jgi:hydrogenase maturation protease
MLPGMESRGLKKLIIGIGNEFRGDDAAGLLVARKLVKLQPSGVEIIESNGDSAALLELWRGSDLVVVIDAVFSGESPGKIHRFEPISNPIPQRLFSKSSTHDFGLVEAVELSRTLDILPKQLIVYGIVGKTFDPGAGLGEHVASAIEEIASKVLEDIS